MPRTHHRHDRFRQSTTRVELHARDRLHEEELASTKNARRTVGLPVLRYLIVLLRQMLRLHVDATTGVSNPSHTQLVLHQFLRNTADELVRRSASEQCSLLVQFYQHRLHPQEKVGGEE